MIIGDNIGIGPAIRVVRHLTERQRLHQIKFSSGERALLLIAGMPAPSIELVRLVFGGLVPWETVWKYNPTRAGGYSDYIHKVKAMFSAATGVSDDSLRHIRDALLPCQSIMEARNLLIEREWRANSATREFPDGSLSYDPGSSTTDEGWEDSILFPRNGSSLKKPKISVVPNRYRIGNDGDGRILTCMEAPTIKVRVERGLAIPAKQARKYPAGTIFLDGAAQGDPFIEIKKEVYNLDHPQGCIRSLATCEQAIILIRKVIDLRKHDWVVFANDADLDTVFAIWVLVNHMRLNDEFAVQTKIMPLLRLAGIIDAHGLEAQELAAFPPNLLHSTSTTLKQLQQEEIVLKGDGRWSEVDLLDYIAGRLRAIDELIYSPENFEGLCEIDELARAQITSGSIVVACRSESGMDEIERQLQTIYGDRLGVLIVENAPSSYMVRQLDRMLPGTLERAYERLNLLDPTVRSGSQNRWHGSTQIGSSPRHTGTGLSPTQIIEAVRQGFHEPTVGNILSEIPRAALPAAAGLLPALAVIFATALLRERGYIAGQSVFPSAVVLAITAGSLFWSKARRVPGLYGWRAPTGFGWLAALPVACIGAVIGGVWAPGSLGYRIGVDNPVNFTASAALLLGLGAELLFRGVILGHVASRLPIQKTAGPWWGSWPTLISSALYAAASLLLFLSFSGGHLQTTQGFAIIAGAVAFGTASGIARERSESIIPSILLHWFCAALLLLSARF